MKLMTGSKIQPFLRHGVWITLHDRYGQAALHTLEELVKKEAEYVRMEERLKAAGEDPDWAAYLMMKAGEDLDVMSVTVEILCCMSVEAFLNFYGVVRLGEEFYKRNFERLGIAQKTEALLATCQGVLLPNRADITQIVLRMFERRNSLVHPKAKDITNDIREHVAEVDDAIGEAKKRVEDLTRFFNLFKDYDQETGFIAESVLRVEGE